MAADIRVHSNTRSDWVVSDAVTGREFGHYRTAADAEAVGIKLARKRKSELVVVQESGREIRRRPKRVWVARLLGRF
jgi:hypothetical protein